MKLFWTIKTAAAELGWSDRHLRRVIVSETDIQPKIFKVDQYSHGVPHYILIARDMEVLRKIKAQARQDFTKCAKYADTKRRKVS